MQSRSDETWFAAVGGTSLTTRAEESFWGDEVSNFEFLADRIACVSPPAFVKGPPIRETPPNTS